ncbi:MAG TPA: phosphatase PAP2 family protein [Anaerolineae bacterium]|nr:phosphatase PAP2 family protein [Anaerolineae bacterium]
MDQWLESLVPWGAQAIAWVQAHSSPALDGASKVFTFFGYEEVYLLLLPLVYWCISREIGIGLGYVSLLSAWLNGAVKHVFAIPRPSGEGIEMKAPRLEVSPSFPSGHAQNAVANWGYLALRFRSWALRLAAALLIAAIGLSRIVLGVHFPQDLLGGWLIGLVLVAVYAALEPQLRRWFGEQRTAGQVVLAVGFPILLMLVHPADTAGLYPAEGAVTPTAALVGLGVGVIMERRWVGFQVGGAWWLRLVRYVLGVVLVGALWAGPKLLLPEDLSFGVGAAARFVRYALLGWAVAFFCPWLFTKLSLASREKRE